MNQAGTSSKHKHRCVPGLRHAQLVAMIIFSAASSLWFHFHRYQDVRRGDQLTMIGPARGATHARAQSSFFFLNSLRRPQQSALLTNSQIRYAGPQQHLPR